MASVRLGQLFACMEQGGALVAEAADGQLLHINDVPSGLACNCICPGCGKPMVAKKGDLQAHHFAHHAQQDGRSCASAGESALHKFAKRVLDERLEIALPAMVVADHGDREVVVQADRRTFDGAILETKDGLIVPDVVLLLRDRRLIVEFKVTHSCDEQKIDRIRAMNVGAIEIDLSQYRDHMLSEIGGQILYDAPRIWLHNPRERDARERLQDRARQRADEQKKLVERHRTHYRHRSPSKAAESGASETAARNDDLGDLINLPVDGAGCFTVAVAEWQAAVLLTLVAATTQPFRTRNGLATLRERGWLDRNFADIKDEVASAVRKAGIPFNSPIKTIEAYFQRLQRLGFVHSDHSEIWRTSDLLRGRIENARELRERPVKRMTDVRHLVGEMLANLPEEERAAFVFDEWWSVKLPGRGYSACDAAHFEETKWRSFHHDLSNIATQVRFSPRQGLDLIALPYEGALVRTIERKRLETEERERAKQAKLEVGMAARVARLRSRAIGQIGEEAETWLITPNIGAGGRSPLEAAASDDSGYDEVTRALDRKAREIEIQVRASQRKAKAIAELEAVAHSRYYDADRAGLWMRSKRHELGGRSPEEFTVDDTTRLKCVGLLPAKRSRR